MRNFKQLIAGIVIGAVVFGAIPVMATNGTKNISAVFKNIKVTLDGKEVKTSAEPFQYAGKLYVSVDLISQISGAKINYNSNNNTLQITVTSPRDTDWKETTSSLLNRTNDIIKQDNKLDVSKHREIAVLAKKMNPIRQDSEAYIPPKGREDIYTLLKEYIKAIESKLNARAKIGMYREFKKYGEELSAIDDFNFYKERADSMLKSFNKNNK